MLISHAIVRLHRYNQLVSKPVNQSINQSTNQSSYCATEMQQRQLNYQSVNQSISSSVSHSFSKSMNMKQEINQTVFQQGYSGLLTVGQSENERSIIRYSSRGRRLIISQSITFIHSVGAAGNAENQSMFFLLPELF